MAWSGARDGRWRPALLVVVGLGLVVLAATLWSAGAARTATTTGDVVEIRGTPDGARPVIAFEAGGEVHTVEAGVAERPPAFAVGDPARIAYDPSDPTNADLDDPLVTRWGPLGLAAGGVLLLGLGGAGLRRRPRPD